MLKIFIFKEKRILIKDFRKFFENLASEMHGSEEMAFLSSYLLTLLLSGR